MKNDEPLKANQKWGLVSKQINKVKESHKRNIAKDKQAFEANQSLLI